MLDRELLEYLKRYGIADMSELQKLEKEDRNDIIRKMKGVTIMQLARITGISKSVIDRI